MIAALFACAGALLTMPDFSVAVDRTDHRGTWEGWGCSLCWWANALGPTEYRELYADVVFSMKTRHVLTYDLPGLGLSIARYNIGGGSNGDPREPVPPEFTWYHRIPGFWQDPKQPDPSSAGWDWNLDAGQRAMLHAAVERGARIECFANAPMWWMTKEQSPAGGALLPERRRDFAHYLASVVEAAGKRWNVPVESLEPFNEPNAWWWKYPGRQEGVHVPPAVQAEIIGYVREELDRRGLKRVHISASDENTDKEAIDSYGTFLHTQGPDGKPVAEHVDRVNVHAYYGLEPNRNIDTRQALRKLVGAKPLWMTEFGDPDGGGIPLATTILQDLNYLRPTAWCYWQPIEPASGWGLLNAKFGGHDEHAADRGAPTWVYFKYFSFAQFTRFIRPGNEILGTNNEHAVVAYDRHKHELVFVVMNDGPAGPLHLDVRSFAHAGQMCHVTVTNCDGPKLLQTSDAKVTDGQATIDADKHSILSIVFDDVR